MGEITLGGPSRLFLKVGSGRDLPSRSQDEKVGISRDFYSDFFVHFTRIFETKVRINRGNSGIQNDGSCPDTVYSSLITSHMFYFTFRKCLLLTELLSFTYASTAHCWFYLIPLLLLEVNTSFMFHFFRLQIVLAPHDRSDHT